MLLRSGTKLSTRDRSAFSHDSIGLTPSTPPPSNDATPSSRTTPNPRSSTVSSITNLSRPVHSTGISFRAPTCSTSTSMPDLRNADIKNASTMASSDRRSRSLPSRTSSMPHYGAALDSSDPLRSYESVYFSPVTSTPVTSPNLAPLSKGANDRSTVQIDNVSRSTFEVRPQLGDRSLDVASKSLGYPPMGYSSQCRRLSVQVVGSNASSSLEAMPVTHRQSGQTPMFGSSSERSDQGSTTGIPFTSYGSPITTLDVGTVCMAGAVVRTPTSKAAAKSKALDKSNSKIGRPKSDKSILPKVSDKDGNETDRASSKDGDLDSKIVDGDINEPTDNDGIQHKALSNDTLAATATGQGNSESSSKVATAQGGLPEVAIPLSGGAGQLPEGATNFNWKVVQGPEGQLSLVPFSIAMSSSGSPPPLNLSTPYVENSKVRSSGSRSLQHLTEHVASNNSRVQDRASNHHKTRAGPRSHASVSSSISRSPTSRHDSRRHRSKAPIVLTSEHSNSSSYRRSDPPQRSKASSGHSSKYDRLSKYEHGQRRHHSNSSVRCSSRSNASAKRSQRHRRRHRPQGHNSTSSSSTSPKRSHRSRHYHRRRRSTSSSSSSSPSGSNPSRCTSHSRRSSLLSSSGSDRGYPASKRSSNSSRSLYGLDNRHGVTNGRFYVPAERAVPSYRSRCPGCKSKPCKSKITMKDYDVASNIANKSPSTSKFSGEDDDRSGSTFVREILAALEGHDAITKYLWAKHNTEKSIWAKLIKGTQPPTRCYLDYEKHLESLCSTIRKLYDNDDAIAKAEVQFVTCRQGSSESLSNYIKRLESIVTELHFMGIRTYEYILKRRLYDGLNSDYLREKVDKELSDSRVSYDKFVSTLSNFERRRLGREQRQKLYDEIVTSRLSFKDKSKGSSTARLHTLEAGDTNATDPYIFAVGADSMSITCYRCLQSGHPARLCRGQISNLETRCSKCGNPNHSTDLCEVPTKSLNCQRCLQSGHLAYVCPASKPVDPDSNNQKSKGKTAKSNKFKFKAGARHRPGKPTTTRPGPSTPSTNAKVVDESNKANTIGSSSDPNSTIWVSPLSNADLNSNSNALHTDNGVHSSNTSSRSSKISMVVGDLSVCGVVRPVLYDTGADVSLIAIGTLRKITNKRLCFNDPSVQGRVNVANGSSLSILGKVELEVGYGNTYTKDAFLLASDDLSTPVIVGCSTMAKLRTTISISPDGIYVRLGDRPPQVSTVEGPEPRLSLRDMDWLRKVAVMHVSHVVSLSSVSTSRVRPSISIKPSSLDFSYGVEGGNYVLYDTFNDDIAIYPDVPVSIAIDSTACINTVTDSDTIATCDLLPPWQAISREWVSDKCAPLGRVSVEVPWRSLERPGFNFHFAAKRGLASIARLDSKQQSMFEDALSQLVDKGFCSIVCDLRATGLKKPTRAMCQQAWSTLVKGTACEGSSVPLAEHYTPSHLVYRPLHPTTPCRIVFDFRELNRFSNRGGFPQNHLAGCLLAIRSYQYFIAGDLSKAFCRMQSNIRDVPYVGYTCIGPYVVLWSRVAFGSTAAPNQLDASMEDVSTEVKDLSTLASSFKASIVRLCDLDPQQVERCLVRPSPEALLYLQGCPPVPKKISLVKFVDDIYTGGSSKPNVLSSYNFFAYISNGHDFIIESKKRFASWEPVIVDNIEERRHLLGYDYSAVEDSFYATFSGGLPKGDPMTKRQSCAVLASFYDPLGLLVEHDMRARSIWRDVNKSTTEWESIIPAPLKDEVCDWASISIRLSKTMPTPRFIHLDSPLVLSTDASKNAWGADLRSTSTLSVRLAGKGGLFSNPQLPWSIPRKELDALYRGLLWVKALSPFLPVATHYAPHQAPLHALFPKFLDQGLTVLVDSEVTVYRLRRPRNDSRLPAPEQRRLSAVRKLCLELNAIIKHVPSNCNVSDSISRCALPKTIDADIINDAIQSSTVVYEPISDDYLDSQSTESTSTLEDAGCGLQAHTIASSLDDAGYPQAFDDASFYVADDSTHQGDCACLRVQSTSNVNLVNCDGLNLPNINGSNLAADEKDELNALLGFVDTSRGATNAPASTLDDIEFKDRLAICVRRCQAHDEDLSKFKDYLQGKATSTSIGLRRTVFERMSKHCHLDAEGIIRQRRWYSSTNDDEDGGTIYLGNSTYAYLLLCVLAAIYHYSFGHPGRRRLRLIINRRFTARGISTAVDKTTASCTLCLRARASKSTRYLNSDVQDMVATQLWQLVGIDIVGPYGRPPLRRQPRLSSSASSSSIGSNGDSSLDPAKDYYVLVCQDAVSGYIVARPMRNSKAGTLASTLHSIFCEHGAPAVVVSDRGIHTLMSRAVRSILAKHGTRQYTLPGYSQHLTFWERSHRDLAQTSRAIEASSATPDDYIFSYLLAVRCYNSTPRYWSTLSPSSLHYSYRQRLPGDLPPDFPSIDWDKLEVKYLNVDYLPYVRSLLPTLADQQEKVKITVQEYVDAWRQKQADLRERSIRESPQDYKLELYDLVYLSETSDNAIGRHLSSTWRGPLTVVRLAGTAMVYLFNGILLPNDYGGNLQISEDGRSIENGPEHSKLVYASLKNLVPARALQSLIYDHYEQGTRVYQDANGDFVTMPASSDGTDQSKITLRRAKQLVAGTSSSSSNLPTQEENVILPGSEELPLSPRSTASNGLGNPQSSNAADASSSVQPQQVLDTDVTGTSSSSTILPSNPGIVQPPRVSQRASTTLVFGSPISSDLPLQQGWLVVSTSSTYRGLASIDNDVIDSDLVTIRPVHLSSGGSGVLSNLESDALHDVSRSRLIYITSSSRPLTRSLLKRTTNLLERLGIN